MSHLLLDLLEHARRQYADDRHRYLGKLDVTPQPEAARVRGEVLDRQTADGFMVALRAHAPHVNWRDELTTLVTGPDYSWALCQRPVADVRREPINASERVTQALYGEPIEVLRRHETWAFVRLSDGYLGWMHAEPLHLCTIANVETYQQQVAHIVKQPFTPCYANASGAAHEQLALLPFGTAVAVDGHSGAMQRVRWPNGTMRWIATCDLIGRADIPQGSIAGVQAVVPWLHMLIGVPYLWGGKSSFGIDCSGLMQLVFGLIGVPLQRDADQQAQAGQSVAFEEIEVGDLLFFDTSTHNTDLPSHVDEPAAPQHRSSLAPSHSPYDRIAGRITHVGMALNRTDFIHSSWRGGGVIWGSFDPRSPFYTPTYDRRFLGARRYVTSSEN